MLEATGLDKVLHFLLSYFIALFDVTAAVAAGIGKEIYDVLRGGVADPLDLAADALGIIAAVFW